MEEERGQCVLRTEGAVAPRFSVLQEGEMPRGSRCASARPRPRQECPCPCRACPPREIRALSRQAAFPEHLLCSPCQAGHPGGAGELSYGMLPARPL